MLIWGAGGKSCGEHTGVVNFLRATLYTPVLISASPNGEKKKQAR